MVFTDQLVDSNMQDGSLFHLGIDHKQDKIAHFFGYFSDKKQAKEIARCILSQLGTGEQYDFTPF